MSDRRNVKNKRQSFSPQKKGVTLVKVIIAAVIVLAIAMIVFFVMHSDSKNCTSDENTCLAEEETMPPEWTDVPVLDNVNSEAWYPDGDKLYEGQMRVKGKKIYNFDGTVELGSINGNTATITTTSGPENKVTLKYSISGNQWTLQDAGEYKGFELLENVDGLLLNRGYWYFIKNSKLYIHDKITGYDAPTGVTAEIAGDKWNIGSDEDTYFETKTDANGKTYYSQAWALEPLDPEEY